MMKRCLRAHHQQRRQSRCFKTVFISADQFFTSRRVQFATLATHYRVPAIYSYRAFAEVGGLMSYGPNLPDQYRQLGIYTGRILKGEKPADLPVQTPTKFELVINIHTAKTLGLIIPPGSSLSPTR
jgi:ABC-type uncharacterized transport system substrate-binding protein